MPEPNLIPGGPAVVVPITTIQPNFYSPAQISLEVYPIDPARPGAAMPSLGNSVTVGNIVVTNIGTQTLSDGTTTPLVSLQALSGATLSPIYPGYTLTQGNNNGVEVQGNFTVSHAIPIPTLAADPELPGNVPTIQLGGM